MKLLEFLNKNKLNLSVHARQTVIHFIKTNNISSNDLIHVINNSNLKTKIVLYHILDEIVEQKPTYLNCHAN